MTSDAGQSEWWSDLPSILVSHKARYLGGNGKGKVSGRLRLSPAGIEWGLQRTLARHVAIPWEVVRGIEISDSAGMRVSAGRVVALGVFALAAKKRSLTGRVAVETADRIYGFEIDGCSAPTLSDKFLVVTRHLQGPQSPTRSGPAPTSVADELGKLAELRTAGVLTDDEFAAQKARLLG